MKKLRIRDRLLLGLALSADYILPAIIAAARGKTPKSAPSWLPEKYKQESFYSLTSRLYRTGYIEKVIKDGQPHLQLTNKGEKVIKREFSFIKMQEKKWDRKWRLVIFDFPEKMKSTRDFLREKLLDLNFGKLQRSIYISPYDYAQDLAEFLANHKILGYAFVLTAKHELMGDPQDLAARVWPLEKINQRYEDLLDKIEKGDLNNLKIVQKIKSLYLEIILEDPFLPKDLLSEYWLGDKVRELLC
jgi:phenylacetic acid degradation operon negative regulatory protein